MAKSAHRVCVSVGESFVAAERRGAGQMDCSARLVTAINLSPEWSRAETGDRMELDFGGVFA